MKMLKRVLNKLALIEKLFFKETLTEEDKKVLTGKVKGNLDLAFKVTATDDYRESTEYFHIYQVNETTEYMWEQIEYGQDVYVEIVAVNHKREYLLFSMSEMPRIFSVLDQLDSTEYYPVETSYSNNGYLQAIRWLGAFNTGVAKRKSFEEVLDHETNTTVREVAAQVGRTLTEIMSLKCCDYDTIGYTKVGVLFDSDDIVAAFNSDVWSLNIGSRLIPTRSTYVYEDNDDNIIDKYTRGLLEYIVGKDAATSAFYYENKRNYSDEFVDMGSNAALLQEILDTMEEDNIEYLRHLDVHYDFSRRTLLNEIRKVIMSYGIENLSYQAQYTHTEGFIRKGAKPTAIVVCGRIRKQNMAKIRIIARDKNLAIIYL